MRWADYRVRTDVGKLAKRAEVKHTPRTQEKGKATAEMGGLCEEGCEKIVGEDRERMKEGKNEQKEWLDNTSPDSHPCAAGNKEEEHTIILRIVSTS